MLIAHLGRILGWTCCAAPVALLILLLFSLWVSHKYVVVFGRHPWHWWRAKRGWGRGLDYLARRLEMGEYELETFQPSYREFTIPKRSGGVRRIHAPDPKTKELQQKILHRILRRLRAHPAACGFERGRSIVENALPHTNKMVVIKLDVQDFFPSTRADRIEAYFRRIGWNAAAAACLTRLVTHEGGLPQGAPTSPRLSNLVNYLLDVQLARLAQFRKGRFTRYADDITFSFYRDNPRRIRGVVQLTRRILKARGYTLRSDKTRILRRHQRQIVTGLVVNERVQLPRAVRRRLRAMKHRLSLGQETTQSPAQRQGWLALESMVQSRAAARQPSE